MYRQISLVPLCYEKNFDFIKADCRDQSLIKKLVSQNDLIIPLACLVGAPLCEQDPWAATAINRDIILEITNQISSNQMLIYPCTNSGYGLGKDSLYCNEETALNPISLYGKTKVEAEGAILESGKGISLRLATVFGTSPRMRLDLLVNDFVYRAYHDRYMVLYEAHFKRNYVHIRDVVSAFTFATNNFLKMKGQAYNIGLSEANLSKLELCQHIQKHLPSFNFFTSEIGEDIDKRNYIVSNEKIEKLGFKAKHTLDDGIKELIKAFAILKNTQFSNV
jgi:nucleoside-diphosphate-sugar epimerase